MPSLPSDAKSRRPAQSSIPQPGPLRRAAGYLRDRPHLLLIAAIIVLAVVLRLGWIAYVNPDPNDGRQDDTLFYDHAAQSLAAGEGYTNFLGAQTAQWPPGYSLVLAVIYKTAGHHILLPKLLNVLAGAATCLFIYLLGTKVFNRRVGLLAALVFAAFPGQVFFSTLLMTESVTPALVSLLLLLVVIWVLEPEEPSLIRRVLLGVLFGAAMLTRGEAGVLLFVVLLVWKLAVPSWRRFARQSVPLVLAAALAVLPWTVRNAVAMHAFVPVITAFGHTLLAGHQSDPYNPYHVFPEAKFQQEYQDIPFPEREIKVEQASTRASIKFIIHHPHDELLVFPFEKLFHLYRDDSDALTWVRGARPQGVPAPEMYSLAVQDKWSALANGYYYTILLAAAVGIPLWFSIKDKRRLLIVLLVLGWTAAHLLFLPTPRYHSPLMPILALWAAVTAIAAYDWLAKRLSPSPSGAGPSRDVNAAPPQERNLDQPR